MKELRESIEKLKKKEKEELEEIKSKLAKENTNAPAVIQKIPDKQVCTLTNLLNTTERTLKNKNEQIIIIINEKKKTQMIGLECTVAVHNGNIKL